MENNSNEINSLFKTDNYTKAHKEAGKNVLYILPF